MSSKNVLKTFDKYCQKTESQNVLFFVKLINRLRHKNFSQSSGHELTEK